MLFHNSVCLLPVNMFQNSVCLPPVKLILNSACLHPVHVFHTTTSSNHCSKYNKESFDQLPVRYKILESEEQLLIKISKDFNLLATSTENENI
jgi:hypothetical protein